MSSADDMFLAVCLLLTLEHVTESTFLKGGVAAKMAYYTVRANLYIP